MCLYFPQQGQCAWMEMHQFIGDFITSGNTTKVQPDVLNTEWSPPGGGEALGFKGASVEPLRQQAQNKPQVEPSQQIQPGASQKKGEARDRRGGRTVSVVSWTIMHNFKLHLTFILCLDLHYACTCPGCPYSTCSPSFEFLKPRQPLTSPPRSEAVCHLLPDTEPSSTTQQLETRAFSRQQREEADRGTQSEEQNSDIPASRVSSASHLSMFPCLGCLHSHQSCIPLLSQQDGMDSTFSHGHHYFHHHHCRLTSCLPCPQLLRSHAPQMSGAFPCFPCQHSFPACTQECPHQRRHTDTQQQEERGRLAGNVLCLHPCMHCSASFSRPSQLLQHQRSEHAHKPPGFLCTECGRSFNSHSNLRIHLNVHTGARPYSCSDCGKSFSQSGSLKIHRRIHTGERPYSCGFCDRAFPHLSAVRTHQRIHTGEKPYHCSQCGKCFTQSGSLKIHTLRVHRRERPFVCSICGKRFSHHSAISFHYRTIHGLVVQHIGEPGAGSAYQTSSACVYPPRSSRTLLPVTAGLNAPNSSANNSHTALVSRDSPALTAACSGPDKNDSQPEGANPGYNREKPLYTCEDCGLRFKDAPSRNKHQIMMHYISEGSEDDEGQSRKLNANSGEYCK